ncbi:LysR family transcriptional regulator [Streptomyces sp. ERV7]|uniref:LysR family transcriptional regulator n=1 Tax=Streptomyces sp. ERV7 TaxID=1322334 RepID=UPI000B315466|nr:LysR family transcriptional regulator [Streptomyces sp. ERV7]
MRSHNHVLSDGVKGPLAALHMLLSMSIELHHLRGFLALADEKHFTRAAKRMNVSQPTLSRNIRRLEELVGRRLLERTTRQVALTPAGEELYDQLRVIIPRLEAALRPEVHEDVFRVGFAWGFPTGWTQEVIASFEAETGMSVRVHRHDAKLAGVDRGDADLAILRGRVSAANMRSVTLLRERRIVAVSTRSELAGREEIRWQEIADHRLVLNEVSGTTDLADWPSDRRPSVSVVCRNFDEWLEAVASNKGVGVVPEFVGRQHIHPFVSFLSVPDAPSVPLNLVYPQRGGHPLIRRFVTMAQAALGTPPGGPGPTGYED